MVVSFQARSEVSEGVKSSATGAMTRAGRGSLAGATWGLPWVRVMSASALGHWRGPMSPALCSFSADVGLERIDGTERSSAAVSYELRF